MRTIFKPSHIVLALLCAMYFITYIDRVNIGTAATEMQHELGLNNTQLGFVFSAFAYPYLAFQIFGGWIGDRFGPRRTLAWCGGIWAVATLMTGTVHTLLGLIGARLLLGFGEGATFPTATRAIQDWTPAAQRGFAQGLTHAFSRLGNFITPALIAALMAAYTWRGSFVALGLVSLIWVGVWAWYFRDAPRNHPGITAEELETLPVRNLSAQPVEVPWGPLLHRLWPVTLTYFCYGWSLWLYLNWLPLFFKSNFGLHLESSVLFTSAVFLAGVIGDTLGGVASDLIRRRTGNVRLARLGVTIVGFAGAFLSLLPILFTHDLGIVTLSLSGGFFFAELVIGPMWAVPMDIAPNWAGTASGFMNVGSALAAIVSPLLAGWVIDLTANWYLPFLIAMGFLVLGAFSALLMHPELPFEPGSPNSVGAGSIAA
jgi:MFS family permease